MRVLVLAAVMFVLVSLHSRGVDADTATISLTTATPRVNLFLLGACGNQIWRSSAKPFGFDFDDTTGFDIVTAVDVQVRVTLVQGTGSGFINGDTPSTISSQGANCNGSIRTFSMMDASNFVVGGTNQFRLTGPGIFDIRPSLPGGSFAVLTVTGFTQFQPPFPPIINLYEPIEFEWDPTNLPTDTSVRMRMEGDSTFTSISVPNVGILQFPAVSGALPSEVNVFIVGDQSGDLAFGGTILLCASPFTNVPEGCTNQ